MIALPKGMSHVMEEKITNQCRHLKLRMTQKAMLDATREPIHPINSLIEQWLFLVKSATLH